MTKEEVFDAKYLEFWEKARMLAFICLLVLWGTVYLLFSFVLWELNPGNWPLVIRGLAATALLCAYAVVACVMGYLWETRNGR